jgi:tetratricopeptide (TPR) repeat protein
MSEAIQLVKNGKTCEGLGAAEINRLLDALAENLNFRNGGWRQDNLGLHALLAMAQKDPQSALAYFNQALDADPRSAAALAQAAQLGAAGYPNEGLAHLDHFDALPKTPVRLRWSMASLHAWLLDRQGFIAEEIAHMRTVLEEDARAGAAKPQ